MRDDSDPKSINQCLEQGRLGRLLKKAHDLMALDEQFKSVLDKDTAQHCKVASIKNGVILVTTDSAAWATRIRYQAPQLIMALKTIPSFANVQEIHCKVAC